jgi:hypothetical protein
VLEHGRNASIFDGSLATLISTLRTLLDDRERRMTLDREAAKAARRLDVPSIAVRHLDAWTPS